MVKTCSRVLTNCHEMLFPPQRARLMLYFQDFYLCYLFVLVILQFSVPLSCDFHCGIWTGECVYIQFGK